MRPGRPGPAPGCGRMTVVCIDPGHGRRRTSNRARADRARAPGAEDQGRRRRGPARPVALAIARRTRAALLRARAAVVLTRTGTGYRGGNIARAQFCNRRHAALMLRIHADGSTDPALHGAADSGAGAAPGWTDDVYAASRPRGRLVQAALVAATGAADRGLVRRSDLTGFNWANVPAILVETGFLSNPAERRRLHDPAYEHAMRAVRLRRRRLRRSLSGASRRSPRGRVRGRPRGAPRAQAGRAPGRRASGHASACRARRRAASSRRAAASALGARAQTGLGERPGTVPESPHTPAIPSARRPARQASVLTMMPHCRSFLPRHGPLLFPSCSCTRRGRLRPREGGIGIRRPNTKSCSCSTPSPRGAPGGEIKSQACASRSRAAEVSWEAQQPGAAGARVRDRPRATGVYHLVTFESEAATL